MEQVAISKAPISDVNEVLLNEFKQQKSGNVPVSGFSVMLNFLFLNFNFKLL
jgi:hypothetical protein